jgi:nucleotide-binding universal stress UspA family protein
MTVVVVGVSPRTGSPAALRFGAEEARLRGVPLHAVMAWRPPRPPAAPGGRPPAGTVGSPDEYEHEAELTLREYVENALGSTTGVACTVMRGSEVNALVAAARGAALLVVGEPRSGRLGSVVTSLVAPQVVLKAECPVVVMPSAVAVSA